MAASSSKKAGVQTAMGSRSLLMGFSDAAARNGLENAMVSSKRFRQSIPGVYLYRQHSTKYFSNKRANVFIASDHSDPASGEAEEKLCCGFIGIISFLGPMGRTMDQIIMRLPVTFAITSKGTSSLRP
jgi:hypothetical protein